MINHFVNCVKILFISKTINVYQFITQKSTIQIVMLWILIVKSVILKTTVYVLNV